MQAELKNGKLVRGVDSARRLEGAAFDFNSGDAYDDENKAKPFNLREPLHLHVYLGLRPFQFVCSQEALTVAELHEAGEALSQARENADAETGKLREQLLSPAGDQIIGERQGKNSDKQTTSRDIIRAICPDAIAQRVNVSWGEIKDEIQQMPETART